MVRELFHFIAEIKFLQIPKNGREMAKVSRKSENFEKVCFLFRKIIKLRRYHSEVFDCFRDRKLNTIRYWLILIKTNDHWRIFSLKENLLSRKKSGAKIHQSQKIRGWWIFKFRFFDGFYSELRKVFIIRIIFAWHWQHGFIERVFAKRRIRSSVIWNSILLPFSRK